MRYHLSLESTVLNISRIRRKKNIQKRWEILSLIFSSETGLVIGKDFMSTFLSLFLYFMSLRLADGER